ncbi:MAG: oxygenase MpaB family protein [Haloechinothrix sp.]
MTRAELTDEQAKALTLGPDSASWQYTSDIRGFFGAGYALLLQTAHPTISSGVRDHSNYKNEPWQRLFRTLDYVNLTIYGGEDAVEVTQRLREMHKRIKGANPDGSRYHALEPEAYAWVQATLVRAVIAVNERFIGTMSAADRERVYAEWLGLARLLGVRDGDLPAGYDEFDGYFQRMVETKLGRTESALDVIASLKRPARPWVLPAWTEPLWRLFALPASYVLTLTTAGLLPPVLRERLGLSWGPWRERQLRVFAAVSRALTRVLPQRLKVSGPDYLRQRRRDLAYDEFAPQKYRTQKYRTQRFRE